MRKILIMALATLLFAACQHKAEEPAPPAEPAAAAPAAPAAPEAPAAPAPPAAEGSPAAAPSK